AYSMGARILSGALADLAARPAAAAAPPLGEVVLAAPDVEARLFARDLAGSARLARRVTLYASARDRALNASRRLHRHGRAGEGGRRILILPGLDTIDVSRVRADMLGRAYLAAQVADLQAL